VDHLPAGGPPTFRIHGQIYHNMGPLLPIEGVAPVFSQIYFHDTAAVAAQRRLDVVNLNSEGPAGEIMHALQDLITDCSPHYQRFKCAIEEMIMRPDYALVLHADRAPVTAHSRRYNAPSVDEVAVLIPGNHDQTGAISRRDFVVRYRGGEVEAMDVCNMFYDPLQYVLFFPYGEFGWHTAIPSFKKGTDEISAKKVTARQYYAYVLMPRYVDPASADFDSALFYGGKALQQYIVDQYAKIEQNRLNYIRHNQAKLRVDLYQGLRDSIAEQDENVGGMLVVLPSSFTGSPRYMNQCYQDAMAVVREYGKPHLFITFTCNPHWDEITNHLLPNQTPTDRPDLVSRAFNLKLKQLIHDLKTCSAFGPIHAYVYVVEFQKRGLPHAHILLILQEDIDPDDYDKYVSAEIPCAVAQSELFSLVTKHMVHKCNERCCGSGLSHDCEKRFPKDFQNSTTTCTDGYPLYRRRSPTESGHVAEIRSTFFSFFKKSFE
jgi:hypothetical protein